MVGRLAGYPPWWGHFLYVTRLQFTRKLLTGSYQHYIITPKSLILGLLLNSALLVDIRDQWLLGVSASGRIEKWAFASGSANTMLLQSGWEMKLGQMPRLL
jgi:hypothetical protein